MSDTEKAMELLQKSKKSKQPQERAIAEYLMAYIEKNPDQAGKLLDESKSISKMLANVKAEARKQATSGCACIASYEVFEWVRDYYDLVGAEPDDDVPDRRETPPAAAPIAPPKKKARVLDVNLDDLF